tara:strand:+ start:1653 stop:2288 length:636 start_codon:yes stop_codon:yes gene_type:complete
MSDYVYLKLQKFSGSDLTVDTIPLKITSAAFSVDKNIPNFTIPFGGIGLGQSRTIALDTGKAERRLSLTGFIVDDTLKRSHTRIDPNDSASAVKSLEFTAQEIAQLIASGVDATGINEYQAFQEITILMDSKVDKDYNQRASTTQIPFTFKARGGAGELDNQGAFLAKDNFPTSLTSTGLKGFVSSFSFTLAAETVEIEFSMEFTIADVLP